jgi:predicted GNAT superfamily acetyltransferase
LQGLVPTDRVIAEWWLWSPRVEALLKSGSKPPVPIKITIHVPAEVAEWKASEKNAPKAVRVQVKNRKQFEGAFSRGFAVVGYECDAEGNGTYLLGPSDDASLGVQSRAR